MIQQTDNRILDALSCALRGQTVSWAGSLDAPAWRALFALSAKHKVLPLVADALPRDLLWSGEKNSGYAKLVRQEILRQASRTGEQCLLYRYLRSKGLHPLVMKGVVCRALYPAPEHRSSVDEDLLVRPAEFRRVHEALLNYGLQPVRPELDPMDAYEVPYIDRERDLFIEVHKVPFPPDSPFLDRLNDCFLGVYDRAVGQRIYSTEFLTLAPQDHFLFLLTHSLKHFLFSGFGIRQICDIALFAQAHRQEIDWNDLREKLAAADALDFTRAVLNIAVRLLPEGQLAETLADWDLDGVDPEPLLEDVLEGGIYGTATMSRLHSSNMTLRAAASQSVHGTGAVLYSLFPPLEAMQRKSPYLKKLPVLLPVAWVQRHLGYLWELIRHRGRANSALTSIRLGNERIRLLEQYNIINQ